MKGVTNNKIIKSLLLLWTEESFPSASYKLFLLLSLGFFVDLRATFIHQVHTWQLSKHFNASRDKKNFTHSHLTLIEAEDLVRLLVSIISPKVKIKKEKQIKTWKDGSLMWSPECSVQRMRESGESPNKNQNNWNDVQHQIFCQKNSTAASLLETACKWILQLGHIYKWTCCQDKIHMNVAADFKAFVNLDCRIFRTFGWHHMDCKETRQVRPIPSKSLKNETLAVFWQVSVTRVSTRGFLVGIEQ